MAPVPSVSLEPYRRALASRRLRTALLLGLMVRAPVFAGGVLLTVHTVTTLGGSYSAAGVLVAVVTAATAVSGPWRGRLLDRLGLRRVVPPLLLVTATCWTIAPWVGYRGLLALALVASVLVIPSMPIIRQAVIASVPEQDRRSAISLDTAGFELAFVVAPLVAVWAAAQWSTAWVLFISKMLVVLAGAVIWLVDPPLRAMSERTAAEHDVPRREWFSTRVLVVCLLAFGVTLVLTGSEIGVVAAMRGWGLTPQIGVVLAVLGVGSLLGGLVYGAMPRPLPAHLLLLALALVTVPMAFVSSAWTLVVLSFAAGLFTAPTVTATVDQLSGMVPAETRGEAMGWHGSSLAAGGTLGAPLAGMAIDRYGVGGGFAAVALGGVALALLAVPFMRSGRSAARSTLVRTGTG
jgi:predicted MFS family arabinose efflux permease